MSEGNQPCPDIELVTVFRTGDSGTLALAKSLLLSESVDFLVNGEDVQDLFGWGRFPARMSIVAGLMQVQVRSEDADTARELLAGLSDDGSRDEEDNEQAPQPDAPEPGAQ